MNTQFERLVREAREHIGPGIGSSDLSKIHSALNAVALAILALATAVSSNERTASGK